MKELFCFIIIKGQSSLRIQNMKKKLVIYSLAHYQHFLKASLKSAFANK